MRYYFAPMEGLTDSVYRRLHHKYFPGVDRYYMPFLSPTVHRQLTAREERELPFEAQESFQAVPQLLTKVAEDFLWMAQQCRDRGYDEVNLNLGCPSGTVVSKGKGSGMLRDPEALDRFLDAIFEKAPLPISVKTRIGIEDPEEFPNLLDIYNQYPIKELTVHPRVRKAFYKGSVHMDAFRYALAHSANPLCYNGSLGTMTEIQSFREEFPQVEAVMLGRGLIANPGMLCPEGTSVQTLEAFCDELLEEYQEVFGSARNAMFRLKENWQLLICMFDDNAKLRKQLLKTTDAAQFKSITHQIFHTLPLREEASPDWNNI